MTASSSPASVGAARRITSDSSAFSRQPKVMTIELRHHAAPLHGRPSQASVSGSRSPSNSVSTGPVIQTWPSSRHSMTSWPPGSVTVTLRPVSFLRAAATAAAQAAVPQARVMPTPRSQVLTRDRVRRGDVGERDVGALGKDRMVLEQRAEAGEVVGLDVVDPEDGVRVAHVDDRRRMQDRRVDRADLQFDGAGVAEFLGQRDLVPAEARPAHVDGDRLRLAGVAGVEQPGIGLDDGAGAAALAHQQPADAAGGVAAGIDLAAVAVVDAHEGVGAALGAARW